MAKTSANHIALVIPPNTKFLGAFTSLVSTIVTNSEADDSSASIASGHSVFHAQCHATRGGCARPGRPGVHAISARPMKASKPTAWQQEGAHRSGGAGGGCVGHGRHR